MKTQLQKWIAFSLPFVLLLVISVVLYQLFVNKCIWWSCAPARRFTVYDLSLPNELFPADSGMSTLYADRGVVEAVEEVRSTSKWNGGGAIYKILRFATEKQASKWYSIETSLKLFTQPLVNAPEYLEIMQYKSNVPDQLSIDCGLVLADFRCVYWAQYHEFFIFFSSSIDQYEMRPENFIRVLNYINENFEAFLD